MVHFNHFKFNSSLLQIRCKNHLTINKVLRLIINCLYLSSPSHPSLPSSGLAVCFPVLISPISAIISNCAGTSSGHLRLSSRLILSFLLVLYLISIFFYFRITLFPSTFSYFILTSINDKIKHSH